MHQLKKIVPIPYESHKRKLQVIKSSLERAVLLHPQVIENYEKQLQKISTSLKLTPINEYQAQQKELIQKLHGRCYHLKVRKTVIDLAEQAQDLAHNKDKKSIHQIKRLAKTLQSKIDSFNLTHRTSQINAKFLRFASNCIKKARLHKPLIQGDTNTKIIDINNFNVKEVTHEDYALAQELYALVNALFADHIEEYNTLYSAFTTEIQKELFYHIHQCNGAIEPSKCKKTLMNTMRGILGYAHTITDYYTSTSPYPDNQHILQVLEDLKHL